MMADLTKAQELDHLQKRLSLWRYRARIGVFGAILMAGAALVADLSELEGGLTFFFFLGFCALFVVSRLKTLKYKRDITSLERTLQ